MEYKIGDIVEIEFGSGTTEMVIERLHIDERDTFSGKDKNGDDRFSDPTKVVKYIKNIADTDEDI